MSQHEKHDLAGGQVSLIAVPGLDGLAVQVNAGDYSGVVFAGHIDGHDEGRVSFTYQVINPSHFAVSDLVKDDVFVRFVGDTLVYIMLVANVPPRELLATDWANFTVPGA